MNRRDFLKKSLYFGLSTTLSAKIFIPEIDGKKWEPDNSNKTKDYLKEVFVKYDKQKDIVKDNIKNILDNNGIIEYNRSLELVGNNEVKYFMLFFKIKNNVEFVNKLKEIQTNYGLTSDGRLGEKTLKVLYINIYSKSLEQLPIDIVLRYNEYIEMQNYKPRIKNGKEIYPNYIPDVFNKVYYYGNLNTQNLSGTFIDESLYNLVDKNISLKGNQVFLKKINGKYVVLAYINGKLQLASYTSPGNPYMNGAINTPSGEFKSTWGDRYWISGAKISMGAPMPDAVHIDMPEYSGIFCHAGIVNGEKRSHGCVRLPKKYSKGMYHLFRKYGELYWTIKDN